MSVPDSVEDVDREFLWRAAGITFIWLLVIIAAGVLLLTFQDAVGDLFF